MPDDVRRPAEVGKYGPLPATGRTSLPRERTALAQLLSEFSFRHSERKALGVDDPQRARKALAGIVGKRLTYRGTDRGRTEAQPIERRSIATLEARGQLSFDFANRESNCVTKSES